MYALCHRIFDLLVTYCFLLLYSVFTIHTPNQITFFYSSNFNQKSWFFQTVRVWLSRGKTPHVTMVSRGELYASLTTFDFVRPSYAGSSGPQELPAPQVSTPLSLWHPSMDGRLKVNILGATNLNIKDTAHKVSKYSWEVGHHAF